MAWIEDSSNISTILKAKSSSFILQPSAPPPITTRSMFYVKLPYNLYLFIWAWSITPKATTRSMFYLKSPYSLFLLLWLWPVTTYILSIKKRSFLSNNFMKHYFSLSQLHSFIFLSVIHSFFLNCTSRYKLLQKKPNY